MDDVDAKLSQVIGSFYEAALDPSLWTGLAPQVAAAFDASSAVLKTYDAAGALDLLEVTDNFGHAPKDEALVDYWHRNDLWVERSAAYGAGRVVVGHELVPASELEETGYYRDWLRPLAIHDLVGGVVELGGGLGVLGVHRDRTEAAFGAREARTAAILLPHLERALKIQARLSPVARQATSAALEQSGVAVLVVDGSNHLILYLNTAAEHLLAHTPELYVTGGRLAARDPLSETRLAIALSRALATAQGGPQTPPSAVALPRPERAPLILTAAPLPARISMRGAPGVLVLLRDPETSSPRAGVLQELFGLTQTEAGVAAALCRGASLSKVAAELRIRLSTVRTHLKSVMLKTNTRRQAELVALMFSAAGATA